MVWDARHLFGAELIDLAGKPIPEKLQEASAMFLDRLHLVALVNRMGAFSTVLPE